MAKATDDFEWPPKGDEVSIYEIGPDPWQKLQDASRDAFLARQRERSQTPPTQQPPPQQQPRQSQPRQTQPPKRAQLPQPVQAPAPAPEPTRKLARVLIVSAIIAAAAGWAIQAATARVPVQAVHHPVPAAASPIDLIAAPADADATGAPAGTAPPDRD